MPSPVYVMKKLEPKPLPGTVRKCVLYARVSSKEQEQEGYSIQAQLTLLREYAAQERLDILQEFVDVETAKIAGRHSFNAMLAFLKKRPPRVGLARHYGTLAEMQLVSDKTADNRNTFRPISPES